MSMFMLVHVNVRQCPCWFMSMFVKFVLVSYSRDIYLNMIIGIYLMYVRILYQKSKFSLTCYHINFVIRYILFFTYK